MNFWCILYLKNLISIVGKGNQTKKNNITSFQKIWPSCILGRKSTFKRRAAHANCYTGVTFDRPIRTEICPCDASDYECDIGFVSTSSSLSEPERCIRDKTLNQFDPWKVPKDCKPGQFYNRTKGYVKISDDECVGGENRFFEPEQVIFN